MRIGMIAPEWDLPWMNLLPRELTARGHRLVVAPPFDVVLHMWAQGQPIRNTKNVFFMRRYELFEGKWPEIDWTRVDHLVFVNDWIRNVVGEHFYEQGVTVPTSVVYNFVDTAQWTLRTGDRPKRLGMACHVHPKKNLPLAVQVLAALPEPWELHIAGELVDGCTAEYIAHLGRTMKREVHFYGHVPRNELDQWWDGMGVCLSTSISEGCPNNVIEAMAKGIQPLVHGWPGAAEQFGRHVFHTVEEASDLILFGEEPPAVYRSEAETRFGLGNAKRIAELVESL